MVVNWLEIGIQTAILVLILSLVALYVGKRILPKLRTDAAQWVGAAIGRFMQNLREQAEAEGEGGPADGGGGFKIAGFEITPDLLRTGMQLLKFAQEMGLIKGGAGGVSAENPFLKL